MRHFVPGSFVSWARGASQDDGEDSFCRGKICCAEGFAFLVRIRQIITLPLDLPPSPKGEGLKCWRVIEKCGFAWNLRELGKGVSLRMTGKIVFAAEKFAVRKDWLF